MWGYCAQKCSGPIADYYGWAADFDSANESVYVPEVAGVTSFTVSNVVETNGGGSGIILTSANVTIVLLHINPSVDIASAKESGVAVTVKAGDYLGEFFDGPGWPRHIHVELEIGSNVVRPEEYVCI
jgi:hypothetical protein